MIEPSIAQASADSSRMQVNTDIASIRQFSFPAIVRLHNITTASAAAEVGFAMKAKPPPIPIKTHPATLTRDGFASARHKPIDAMSSD